MHGSETDRKMDEVMDQREREREREKEREKKMVEESFLKEKSKLFYS